MVKTWETGKGEDFTCECGAIYAVTVRRLPARDSDSADCSVCGQKIGEMEFDLFAVVQPHQKSD
jgi:hypothetical protein